MRGFDNYLYCIRLAKILGNHRAIVRGENPETVLAAEIVFSRVALTEKEGMVWTYGKNGIELLEKRRY